MTHQKLDLSQAFLNKDRATGRAIVQVPCPHCAGERDHECDSHCQPGCDLGTPCRGRAIAGRDTPAANGCQNSYVTLTEPLEILQGLVCAHKLGNVDTTNVQRLERLVLEDLTQSVEDTLEGSRQLTREALDRACDAESALGAASMANDDTLTALQSTADELDAQKKAADTATAQYLAQLEAARDEIAACCEALRFEQANNRKLETERATTDGLTTELDETQAANRELREKLGAAVEEIAAYREALLAAEKSNRELQAKVTNA